MVGEEVGPEMAAESSIKGGLVMAAEEDGREMAAKSPVETCPEVFEVDSDNRDSSLDPLELSVGFEFELSVVS